MMLPVGLANALGSAMSLRGKSGVIQVRVLLVAAVAAAVFSSNVLAQSTGRAQSPGAASQTSCAIAATPGVSEQRLTSGGRERTYR